MQDVVITHGSTTVSFNTEYAGTLTKEQFMERYRPTHFKGFDEQDRLLEEAWEKVQAKHGRKPGEKPKQGTEGGK